MSLPRFKSGCKDSVRDRRKLLRYVIVNCMQSIKSRLFQRQKKPNQGDSLFYQNGAVGIFKITECLLDRPNCKSLNVSANKDYLSIRSNFHRTFSSVCTKSRHFPRSSVIREGLTSILVLLQNWPYFAAHRTHLFRTMSAKTFCILQAEDRRRMAGPSQSS